MRHALLVAALAAGTLTTAPLAGQYASPDPKAPMVTATGSGEVSRAPDFVEVSVGLLTRGSSPGGTAAELDKLLAVVRDTLKGRGIPDSSVLVGIRTIEPQRTYPERQITGYTAGLSLKVTLRELGKLGQLLDALAGAGATEIPEVRFKSDHEEEAYQAALAKAVEEASRRAQAAARAAGGRLGPIVMIETDERFGRFGEFEDYTRMEAPQTQEATATKRASVTIYWRYEGR